MAVPLGLAPFAGERRRDCVLVVAAGVIAFLAGYVGTATVLFGFDALAHGAPRTPQRVAGMIGSIACGAAFAFAFTRGKGGPVLDAVVYPAATVAFTPFAFRWIVFGPNWDGLRDRVRFVVIAVDPLIDGVVLLLPAFVTFAGYVSVWGSLLTPAEITAWQREHLQDEFFEAFVAESDDRGD